MNHKKLLYPFLGIFLLETAKGEPLDIANNLSINPSYTISYATSSGVENSSFSDDLELDDILDVEIVTPGKKKKGLKKKDLTKSFSGNIGSSYVSSDAGSRFNTVGTLRYEGEFKDLTRIFH